jgi:hypothetical protein
MHEILGFQGGTNFDYDLFGYTYNLWTRGLRQLFSQPTIIQLVQCPVSSKSFRPQKLTNGPKTTL